MRAYAGFHDLLAIARYHIVLIAVLATLVFGWILTGTYPLTLALVVGLDWFLINLLNRITDIQEDRENGIQGTELVARRRRLFLGLWLAVLVGSLALTVVYLPAITPLRLLVQLIGVGYSCRIVPTLRGLRRFKDLYFWKNAGSAILFGLTCFGYPLRSAPGPVPWAAAVALLLFFLPFELTYEILYDLRDLDGDRLAGVPTYPVVHGPLAARRIIDGLLVGSSLALVGGVLAGALGLREALMLAAPVLQLVFYRPRLARGLTPRDCIVLTHLGSAELLLYLGGTWAWLRLGLPANVYL